MDYMDSRLLRVIKRRFFAEITDSLQQHSNFRKVECYHKFPYTEQPMMGIVIKGATAVRQKLSSDDFSCVLKSHTALTTVKNSKNNGRVLCWVWEDEVNLTKYLKNVDLSLQVTGSNRVFKVDKKPIVSGPFNTKIADNFAQVDITVDGTRVFAEFIDGKKGIIILPQAVSLGSKISISYYACNLALPGRYYLEIINPTQYVINPLLIVKNEEVITKTSGVETYAQLEYNNLLPNFDVLYTKKYAKSTPNYLVRGIDYSIYLPSGVITFLNHLPTGTTLYANYRWIGQEVGPLDLPKDDFQYRNDAISGIVLAFSSERVVGDKNVVIVYPTREVSAKVYSGHWNMTLDVDVFCRDTLQLPELVDHVVNDLWSRKRLKLIDEGITLESVEPSSEFEEEYDQTGDLYYHCSVPITLISEWKRFEPYLTEIMDYNMDINFYPKQSNYLVTNDGRILEQQLTPLNNSFEVTYPEPGYVPYV
jgi:hypothetical protein